MKGLIMENAVINNTIEVIDQPMNDIITDNISLTLFITNRCNERCEHCFYYEELNTTASSEEITLQEIHRMINSIGDKLVRISLTGGEPFLRKDFLGLAGKLINKKSLTSINIVTNGILKERILKVARFILDNDKTNTRLLICVSLDGFEERHDHIRRVPGSFKKTIETIKKLRSLRNEFSNFELSVVTTVSKDNYDQVVDLNKWVEDDLDVYQRINLIRSPTTGVFGVNRKLVEDSFSPEWVKPFDELELSREETNSIISHFTKKQNWRDYHKLILAYSQKITETKKKMFVCNAPYTDLVVFPNGDFTFCEYIKPLGNLKDYNFNFNDYWFSRESEERRKSLLNCACNHPCNLGFNLADNPELNKLLPDSNIFMK